jgi:hypothetical protein
MSIEKYFLSLSPLPVMGVNPPGGRNSLGPSLFHMKGATPRHRQHNAKPCPEAILYGDCPVWIASVFPLAMTTFPATPPSSLPAQRSNPLRRLPGLDCFGLRPRHDDLPATPPSSLPAQRSNPLRELPGLDCFGLPPRHDDLPRNAPLVIASEAKQSTAEAARSGLLRSSPPP